MHRRSHSRNLGWRVSTLGNGLGLVSHANPLAMVCALSNN